MKTKNQAKSKEKLVYNVLMRDDVLKCARLGKVGNTVTLSTEGRVLSINTGNNVEYEIEYRNAAVARRVLLRTIGGITLHVDGIPMPLKNK